MSKDKVILSPGAISEKWGRRLKGAISDIQAGVNAVSEAPGVKAAAKKDKMLQNLTAAVTSGKWGAAVSGVSLSDWKSKTSEKVAQRLSSGVDAAAAKRQKFDNYLVTTLNGVLPQIKNAPDLTLEDSVNRCRMLFEHMHNNPYKK